MSRDSMLRIRTPEGVEFAYRLASPASRMLATLVDLMCVAVFLNLFSEALGFVKALSPDLNNALRYIISFLTLVGYPIVSEWFWRGQTLGKRLFGLRVMDQQGLKLRASQVALRNLIRPVDQMPVLYLVGALSIFLSRFSQRLGDIAAGTVVIQNEQFKVPDLERMAGGKYNSLLAYRHLTARLRQKTSPELATLVVQAILRRDQLEPSARVALFAQLAARLRELVPFPPEATDGVSDEQYIRNAIQVLYQS